MPLLNATPLHRLGLSHCTGRAWAAFFASLEAESALTNVAMRLTSPPACQAPSTSGIACHRGPSPRLSLGEALLSGRQASDRVLYGWEVGPKGFHDFCWLSLGPTQHPGLLLAVGYPGFVWRNHTSFTLSPEGSNSAFSGKDGVQDWSLRVVHPSAHSDWLRVST